VSKSKIKPKDNVANMQNKNAGSPGTNRQFDQNQGNRGKQLGANLENRAQSGVSRQAAKK
jgi:hypothetical protein